ncbi:hypothetical protein AAVH_03740 [Aphelenchoides avenae]|nr:hypothetical protein AAVH_03740 [Aphelenchus avenae]
MTSPLEFEVLPESALRNEHIELLLGAGINQVISALQNASRAIKSVELIYDNKEPLERDITITLKNEGIRLLFDAKTQRLKIIEVFNFKNITLQYCNNVFSAPDEEANVSKVENCFGATHPGVYDEKQKMYLLHWRGVSFCFPAKEPSAVSQPAYAHGLGSLNFVNSSLPLLERMTIFAGSSPNDMRLPEVPAVVRCGNLFLESLESVNENGRITGLKLRLEVEVPPRQAGDLKRIERTVRFGDTQETVLAALGAPSKTFCKSDEKMLIQKGSSSENLKKDDRPDFFFNYFTLGLDILFDCDSRRVLKFVLHTNIPGHYDFAIYSRCKFAIAVQRPGREAVTLRTDSKLEDFRSVFATEDGNGMSKPVVLNKNLSSDGENPFGSTFCYGIDQVIVEVMDNSHIASLILYETDDA